MSDLSLTALEPSPDPMAAETADAAEGIATASRSPFQLAVRRFLRHRAAVVGAIVLRSSPWPCILAPWIAPYAETEAVGDPRSDYLFLHPQSAVLVRHRLASPGTCTPSSSGAGGCRCSSAWPSPSRPAVIGTLVGAFAGFKGGKARRPPDALDRPVPGLPAARRPAGHPPAAREAGVGSRPPSAATTSIRLTITCSSSCRGCPRPASCAARCCRLKEKEFIEAASRARRVQLAHHLPPPHPELHRSDHRRRHVHRGRRHHHRVDAVVLRLRRAAAPRQLGQPAGRLEVPTSAKGKWWLVVFPSLALLLTVAGHQLHRRRPPRRLRPQAGQGTRPDGNPGVRAARISESRSPPMTVWCRRCAASTSPSTRASWSGSWASPGRASP